MIYLINLINITIFHNYAQNRNMSRQKHAKKTQFSVVKFSFSLDSWQHDLTNPFEVGSPVLSYPINPISIHQLYRYQNPIIKSWMFLSRKSSASGEAGATQVWTPCVADFCSVDLETGVVFLEKTWRSTVHTYVFQRMSSSPKKLNLNIEKWIPPPKLSWFP